MYRLLRDGAIRPASERMSDVRVLPQRPFWPPGPGLPPDGAAHAHESGALSHGLDKAMMKKVEQPDVTCEGLRACNGCVWGVLRGFNGLLNAFARAALASKAEACFEELSNQGLQPAPWREALRLRPRAS